VARPHDTSREGGGKACKEEKEKEERPFIMKKGPLGSLACLLRKAFFSNGKKRPEASRLGRRRSSFNFPRGKKGGIELKRETTKTQLLVLWKKTPRGGQPSLSGANREEEVNKERACMPRARLSSSLTRQLRRGDRWRKRTKFHGPSKGRGGERTTSFSSGFLFAAAERRGKRSKDLREGGPQKRGLTDKRRQLCF